MLWLGSRKAEIRALSKTWDRGVAGFDLGNSCGREARRRYEVADEGLSEK